MTDVSKSAWWDFSIEPADRTDTSSARLKDADGRPLVNPPDEGGRQALDYPAYLGLDALLGTQVPASNVPEERLFIILHQLFELVFKQMTFDFGVVAATLAEVEAMDEDEFLSTVSEPLPDERGPSAFWRPAMTAAARLRHSARRVLPTVMSYVGHGEDDDVLFSTLEYRLFRDFLAPASGFQTAQLRLIQRALGKSPVLKLRVFPGDSYGHNYSGCPVGHVQLGDPLILRGGHERAFPAEGEPAHQVGDLDRICHAVLARIGSVGDSVPQPPPVRRITEEDIERVTARLRATLADDDRADEITETFRGDLAWEASREIERRDTLDAARRGAQTLHIRYPQTCLAFVLDRIVATDAALHANEPQSFLTVHRKAVRRHVSDDSGTGGGGMPYLITSQRFLLPLFPALIAYADLGSATTEDDRDRW